MPEELFTAKELSEILKTNVNYVHDLRKAGLLPFLKLGCYKCRRSALEAFLEKYEGYDLTNPYNVRKIDIDGEDEINQEEQPEEKTTDDKNCGIIIDLYR